MKRIEYFAFAVSWCPRVIRFTRHWSHFGAEKHYGDLSKRYKGSSSSDYTLVVYCGRDELEAALGDDYDIDYVARTLTEKRKK